MQPNLNINLIDCYQNLIFLEISLRTESLTLTGDMVYVITRDVVGVSFGVLHLEVDVPVERQFYEGVCRLTR